MYLYLYIWMNIYIYIILNICVCLHILSFPLFRFVFINYTCLRRSSPGHEILRGSWSSARLGVHHDTVDARRNPQKRQKDGWKPHEEWDNEYINWCRIFFHPPCVHTFSRFFLLCQQLVQVCGWHLWRTSPCDQGWMKWRKGKSVGNPGKRNHCSSNASL